MRRPPEHPATGGADAGMWIAIAFLTAMTGVLLALAWRKGDGSHWRGLRGGARMFWNLIPLLALAFLVSGLLPQALPPEVVHSWLGRESGWRGIVVGTFAGALVMGGPYAVLPIVAGIFRAGAGMGTAVAMITGWALLGLGQVIMGLAFIGVRFTVLRILLVLAFPFAAGAVAYFLFS